MDDELREYLEQRFSGMEQRFGRMEQRFSAIEEELKRLGVTVESVQDQIRLVAEGHSILYGAIDRQYEQVQAELRDVRSLLKVWNELVTKRLGILEQKVRERA